MRSIIVQMLIFLKADFVVPGIEDDEWVELTQSEITLKAFLEELSVENGTFLGNSITY